MRNAIDVLNQAEDLLGIKSNLEGIYLHYEVSKGGKLLTITNCDTEEVKPKFNKTKVEKVILDCILPSDCSKMFYEYEHLCVVECTERFSSCNVTDISWMFFCCYALQQLDIFRWDVSNVTDMRWMFAGCESLQQLDVSHWDVSNVTGMRWMFAGCESLQQLDVSHWDVSNVTDMNRMFMGCKSLIQDSLPEWVLKTM